MSTLSKTRILAFRQCHRRLWLELHRPELRLDSAVTQSRFAAGNRVGEIARRLYDPDGNGILVDIQDRNYAAAFERTQALLRSAQPIFEAGFEAEGAKAFADVLLPVKKAGGRAWRMVEVKSSTGIEDYHRDDVAIQAFIAKAAGVPLVGIALAHIDSAWVYPGGGDYRGLLVENDLSDEAFARAAEVREWIAEAHAVARKRKEPGIRTGKQCADPYECGFAAYCQSQEPQARYPVSWLPRRRKEALKAFIESRPGLDLRKVPDDLLNDEQQRVKAVTLSGRPFFDAKGAALALRAHRPPACFMDFETIQFAAPIWKGTRPYQQIPFQFSVHRLARTGRIKHRSFLDLSGADPSKAFAQELIATCGERGPIFVYNKAFESARLHELAERFPRLARPLRAIDGRIVDLWPVARQHYYHPEQHGSWSLKAVLPAVCPDLEYAKLEGVQNGGMAQEAFLEAIAPETPPRRKASLEKQLLAYCALDTFALLRLWSVFSGQSIKEQKT
jgi:hypothetical protein